MKYQVGGAVSASTYIGVFEANSPEEAIQLAYDAADVGVCHQCATSVSDPEVAYLWAEDESGDVTSEPTDHDKLVEAHNRIAELEGALGRAERENEALRIVVQRNPETTLFKDGTYSIVAKDRDGLIRESVSPDVGEAAVSLAQKLGLIAGGKTNG